MPAPVVAAAGASAGTASAGAASGGAASGGAASAGAASAGGASAGAGGASTGSSLGRALKIARTGASIGRIDSDALNWALGGLLLLILGIILMPAFVASAIIPATQPSQVVQIGSGSPIPAGFVPIFNQAGQVFDVDPYLLASEAYQESTFGSGPGWNTVNYAGCVGFMQTCVGGAGGNSWGSTVTLTDHPKMQLAERFAYKLGQRPPSYPLETANHPDYNDPFDAVMTGAVELRGKVGGRPIPSLDNTAYQAACGYYGACAGYASSVLNRARQWEAQSALSPPAAGGPSGVPPNPQGLVNPFSGDKWVHATPRIDEGRDFDLLAGEAIGALGDSRMIGISPGWYKGQPFIWFELLNEHGGTSRTAARPYAGRYWYAAEQITPLLHPSQVVSAGTPVATYAQGGSGLELGWATASGATAAQAAGDINPNTHYSREGQDFANLMHQLGTG
jgi:hypothetical protein